MAFVAAMPDSPRAVGDDWLQGAEAPLLRVPSAIVPEDANLLINPRHPAAIGFRIEARRKFESDARLWRPFPVQEGR